MDAPRVGVIGARRRRQGLGPFVVRDLIAAGAEVPCFVGTSAETLKETASALAVDSGVDARGYLDLHDMLGAERLDALAVLSPAETHEVYLDAASRAGLHVLCEKPFLWKSCVPAERGRAILDRFAAAKRVVVENCPWPWTLPAWASLHPRRRSAAPSTFEMFLEPADSGLQMLGDSLPHALSLLQALIPGNAPRLDRVRYEGDPWDGPIVAAFRFRSGGHATRCRVVLSPSAARPRRAGFVTDGQRAERRVVPGSYEITFSDGDRSVPVPDPMPRLVADFVSRVRRSTVERERAERARIGDRLRLLDNLVRHYLACRGPDPRGG
ncbi:MAG: Gfo/Idh/MocA family oxidoreductase [Myxococcales bacterium]|nr:Gfo/Idh/MocA family oxidoreductase [Myxococcales bacterium]